MFGGMYSVATAVEAMESHQQVVADNLSHIGTPGYRRQVTSFQTFVAREDNGNVNQMKHLGTEGSNIGTDHTAGAHQDTGRPLDFAIRGDGFFEITSPQGPRFTRNGAFFLTPDNTLVTSAGLPVAGANGGNITLPPNSTPDKVELSGAGVIRVDGVEVGKIRVVTFEDNNMLERDGDVTFKGTPDAVMSESNEVQILQGRRELSNVSATHELIKLIAGVRHHDATHRVLRSMSDTLQQRTNAR